MNNNTLTRSETVLLNLIKQVLFGMSFTPLKDVNWDEVLQEAGKQSVSGLIAGIVPDNMNPMWEKVYLSNIRNSVRYLHAQSELITFFKDHDIPLVILKGTAAAVYYPAPLHRTMGDIDFLVPQECFDRACALMVEGGYHETKAHTAYTRHRGYTKGNYSFELHHHFSYDDLDIEQYIIEGLHNPDTGVIDHIGFPMLPKLANGLVLLAHMRCHLKSGLGLRQVIDWMMYVDKELDDDFWENGFGVAADDAGMNKLAVTVTRMCQIYLGLREDINWCKAVDESLCDYLMRILFSDGNFGRKHGEGNRVENVIHRIREKGLFRYLQTAGENTWKFYRRHRWARPFCWLYQIGRLAVKGIESGRGKKVLLDIENSNERFNLLRKIGVYPK